jgi:Domain of unknown function (DUF1772)
MIASAAVRVVAIACTGLLAGIYAGYRAGPHYALQAISPSAFVQFQQIVHVHYVTFVPILVLSAIVAAVAWLAIERAAWRSVEFWLIAASACALVVIAVLSRTISVPLNDQLMTWSIAAPPTDLRLRWESWEQVNTARAWLAIGALVLEAAALNLRAARPR